jgi:hypothetical protein
MCCLYKQADMEIQKKKCSPKIGKRHTSIGKGATITGLKGLLFKAGRTWK